MRETSLRLLKTLRSMPRAAATRFLRSLTPSDGSASLMLATADCVEMKFNKTCVFAKSCDTLQKASRCLGVDSCKIN